MPNVMPNNVLRWSKLLADLLLTTDPVQRMRLKQAGLALLLMSVSISLFLYAADYTHPARAIVELWACASFGGVVLSYAMIRSGFSARFADPSLTLPQMLYAIACSALAYPVIGPMRGAIFPPLMIIMMFGMFQLRARTVQIVAVYALVIFGSVMAFSSLRWPDEFPPWVEAGHFTMLLCMVPAVSLLAARLSRIRRRLAEKNQELMDALAHINVLVTHDELTGLTNRRHLQAQLDKEVQLSQRHGECFCLAILDIDHFKRVNDTYGHPTGDAVLQHFARVALGAVRSIDMLARWGGEEFVLLLPQTPLADARSVLERVR